MIGIVRIGCVCLAGSALLFAGCIAPTTSTGPGGSGTTGGTSQLGNNDGGPTSNDSNNNNGPATDGGTTATCSFSFSNTTCEACFQANCTQSCDACSGDPACKTAVDCMIKCNGDSACESACTTNLSSASNGRLMALLGNEGCIAKSCNVACGVGSSAAGIGDPCSSDSECASGLCANGGSGPGWCSRTCSKNTDCASSSSSITDSHGELVWCLETTGGQYACFPGCSSSSQCSSWYGAGSCVTGTAVNGATASVCSN